MNKINQKLKAMLKVALPLPKARMSKAALPLSIALVLLLLTTSSIALAQSYSSYATFNSSKFLTDYKPNSNTKVIITFSFRKCSDVALGDSLGRGIFGSGEDKGKGAAEFSLSQDRDANDDTVGNTELKIRMGSKAQTITCGAMSYNEDYARYATLYRVSLENGYVLVEQNATHQTNGWTKLKSHSWTPDPSFKSGLPMAIGDVNTPTEGIWGTDENGKVQRSNIRVFEVVIMENGQIVRHYYPSKTGLYDAARNTQNTYSSTTISADDCNHKFLTYNEKATAKCTLCSKDVNLNEWAKDHHNDGGITSMEPFIDMQNLDDDGQPQQTLILSGINKMGDVIVVDADNDQLVKAYTSKSFEASKQLALPNCDKSRTLNIFALTKATEAFKDGENTVNDSITTFSIVNVNQKPLHKIHDVTVTQMPNIQKDGTQKPYNQIKWYINEPFSGKDSLTSNDLMDSDQFMVYRAFKSDYSDEDVFNNGVVGVSSYKVDTDGRGFYIINDNTPEGQYNPNKTTNSTTNNDILKQLNDTTSLTSVEKLAIKEFYKGRTPVYYRVVRAIVDGVWGEINNGFSVRKTLMLHNMLPPVSNVRVEKTDNWSADKKVNIKVKLNNPYVWQFNNLIDSAKVHKLIPEELAYRRYQWDSNTNITIKRFCPESEYDNGEDKAAKTLTIKGSDVKWNESQGCYEATIQDIQALPYTHYYYTAQLDTKDAIYPTSGTDIALTTTEDEANDCYSKSVAAVGNFTATRGEANGGVELEWQMGLSSSKAGESSLKLTRREYKGLNDATGKVEYGESVTKSLDNTLSVYSDDEALPGHVYEYTLQSIFTFRGAEYKTEAVALGWPSHRGSISGKVLLPNGTAVKGAKVYVRSKDPIDIPDVKDEYGKILMQGVHTGIVTAAKGGAMLEGIADADTIVPVTKFEYSYEKELITNDLGEYTDTIDFHSDGTKYEVSVVYGTSSFKNNGNATAYLTLTKSKWEYTNVNMVSDVAYKFSGNVLYENSTVPVRNAMFELIHFDEKRNVTQRELLRDQNGDYIMTDQRGGFNISLLPASAALRVVKDGHTMKDGGYVKIDNDTVFTPQKNQEGLRLWDETKVLLIGRLVGGNVQGNKPLGKGESRNNLGNNLTVELQLEGDNTSQIVYKQDDPDNTTIKHIFDHNICDNKGKSLGYKTNVSYERKRIVISPDVTTGEFFVELPPTKYKVTKLSADGYATLYQTAEGLDVLDYTDSKDTVTYNRIYHKPATVTYTQYTKGRQTPYIGEGVYNTVDMYGKEEPVTVAMEDLQQTQDKLSSGQAHAVYAFGYPVLNSGSNYLIQASAHEDYYYNNDSKSGKFDQVALDGGVLHFRNGLSVDNKDKKYALDSEGKTTLYLTADNPDYINTGLQALRSAMIQVEYNGYYYEAEPLKAFVLGSKDKGVDVIPVCENIQLADIIRDPYGSSSYAWREAGTTYNWTYSHSESRSHGLNLSITAGFGTNVYCGVGLATGTSWSATISPNFKWSNIGGSWSDQKTANFSMTTNQKIATSSGSRDIGAMADVYVGMISQVCIGENVNVAVISKARYDAVKDNVKLVSKGICGKDSCFIVIGNSLRQEIRLGEKGDFVYSQKHILGTLIPDLIQKRDALVLENTTYGDALEIAKKTSTPQYIRNADGSVGMVPPDFENNYADKYSDYTNSITQWEELIRRNEEAKVLAMSDEKNLINSHNTASNGGIDYSQSASSNHQGYHWVLPYTFSFSGGVGGGTDGRNISKPDANEPQNNAGQGANEQPEENQEHEPEPEPELEPQQQNANNPGQKENSIWAGIIFKGSFSYDNNHQESTSHSFVKTTSAGFGYHIGNNDNGYFTMGVYRDVSNTTTTKINNYAASESSDGRAKEITYDSEYADGKSDETNLSNYIYRLEGGAVRSPWFAADVTQFYEPGTALGNNPKKIDKPRLYIDKPVVSNQPEDETAVIQLRLANESELADNSKYLNPSCFILKMVDGTNQNGAKLYIDGSPLGQGREFCLSPGETYTKTLEVQKGVGYNFNDIKLQLFDGAYSLSDTAFFSVNYLPMASKISMKSPTDKWVMNTLSNSDEKGYYIPVTLGDFNVNSEDFHHIDVQYKKQTEGESQWVTFDSFYNDADLYNAATGVKHMIDNGKIDNVKFYGEQDPMEMKYDLRAVAFRKLGTGFTTRTSNVMSGTKDTRCPEVFGIPAPASGILTYEDVIQLNFTEPIAYNYLDKISDFQVQGYTNKSNIALSSSLQFNGADTQKAMTTVERNLNNRSFTIDMMAKKAKDADSRKMVLFSHGNASSNMSFGITADNMLYSCINGKLFVSEPLANNAIDITAALTHVGMTYDHKTRMVSFFAGGGSIKNNASDNIEGITINKPLDGDYAANGRISLGKDVDSSSNMKGSEFKGNMLEVRLWGKVLSETMISEYNGKRLSGYENQLIAHWPMTETTGSILRDNAHGANITFNDGVQWANVDGYSLVTDNERVKLNPELIYASDDADNTITFWYKVDSMDKDSVALFTAGDENAEAVGKGRLFVGFRNDKLVVVSNDNTYVVADKADATNGWHHFAMTVNRSHDQFITYLDGKVTLETKASDIDGVASDYVALGDKGMKAYFDVFSRWEQSVPKYLIQQLYNTRFSGKELGLKAYMPFTAEKESDQGVMFNDSCVYNCTYSKDENGKWIKSKVRMVIDGFDAKNNLCTNDHAPIREMPSLENLDFSWSSTGTALQININRADKDINKQTLFVTVRGIEDEYGNVMTSPQMLNFFVDKNVLKWDTQTIDMQCNESETANATLAWKNISGRRLSFTIDGLPSWMHANYTQGTVEPLEEKTLTIKADAGLAAGIYDAVIYLNDENGLSEPLTVSLTVTPPDCGWSVDKTIFDRTMNLRALVKTKNCNGNYVLDTDTGDKVGAFIANECIGVANISDDGKLYMTLYGDTIFAQNKRDITFRLWMHETGQIHELEYSPSTGTFSQIKFVTNSIVGLPPAQAVELLTTKRKVQSLSLSKGWNWVSFYLQPSAAEGVNSIFINQKGMFSDGDIIKHVDFAQYSENTKDWMGNLEKTDFHNVYQIYVNNPGTYRLIGYELPSDSLEVKVNTGWSDMPYLLSSATTIDNALADFSVNDKAITGDIIKSIDEFAVADGFDGQMKWVGTLKYLQPGVGYYLYHTGKPTSFMYQTNVIADKASNSKSTEFYDENALELSAELTRSEGTRSEGVTPDDAVSNMPVIATLADNVETQEGDIIVAIAGGNIVGYAAVPETNGGTTRACLEPGRKAADTDKENLLFISVNASNGNAVTFGLYRNGEIIATTATPLTYNSNGIVGKLDAPYVIDFASSSDNNIFNSDADIYDLSGRRVNTTNLPRGIYIKGKAFLNKK